MPGTAEANGSSAVVPDREEYRLSADRRRQTPIPPDDLRLRYGGTKQIRFICGEPLCPVGYIQTKNPMYKKRAVCKYTVQGRAEIHKNLKYNESVIAVIHMLGNEILPNRSIEYSDNRISVYSAQIGRCAVTGKELWIDELHCHHITPVEQGGTDEYRNLVILHEDVHRLIHAVQEGTIAAYLNLIKPTASMLEKINRYRIAAGNAVICVS